MASRTDVEGSISLKLRDGSAIRPWVGDMAIDTECVKNAEDEPHDDVERHGVA